jgi:HK97 family phage portal protein
VSVIVSLGKPTGVGRKEFPLPAGAVYNYGTTNGNVPLLRGDMIAATYQGIYESQPIVYAVVNKLVYGVARNPIVVQQTLEDGTRVSVGVNTLSDLLRNPFPRGSEFDIKAHLGLSAFIYGHALLLKYRPGPGQAPTELWPINWRNVQYVSDERGVIGYSVTVGGITSQVGPEDVVHVRLVGGSPMEPLRRTVALEDAAATWQGESLRNGVTPRGAFTSDNRIHDNVLPRLREELTKLYAGPENAGRAAILEGGLKWQQIGLSAADAQLIDQRRFSREEVCAAYDVPMTLLGIQGAGPGFSAYTNVAEYRRALHDAIAARLTLIEDSMNAQLIRPELEWDGLSVRFDTNDLLRPDPEARARMHMLTQQASTTTINERRSIEGLPRIDDPVADTVFMPVNMVPVGAEPPQGDGTDQAGTPAQGVADRVITAALLPDEE